VTDGVTIALIGGAVAIIVAAIQRVHNQINGRMTQLLELTRKSSRAEGAKEANDKPRRKR